MRIWFLHPKYYDKKGLLAQWNEGLILKTIIYNKRNKLTIEKEKSKSKSNPSSTLKSKAWINHPFSKRVTRYSKPIQKKIINTYLNSIRLYGEKTYNINFNKNYLDFKYIDNDLRIPVLIEQIRRDHKDALDKMEVRNKIIYENILKKVKKTEEMELCLPFYYETKYEKYLNMLDEEYVLNANGDRQKIIGTEIDLTLTI